MRRTQRRAGNFTGLLAFLSIAPADPCAGSRARAGCQHLSTSCRGCGRRGHPLPPRDTYICLLSPTFAQAHTYIGPTFHRHGADSGTDIARPPRAPRVNASERRAKPIGRRSGGTSPIPGEGFEAHLRPAAVQRGRRRRPKRHLLPPPRSRAGTAERGKSGGYIFMICSLVKPARLSP